MARLLCRLPEAHKDAIWTLSFVTRSSASNSISAPGAGSSSSGSVHLTTGSVDGTLRLWRLEQPKGKEDLDFAKDGLSPALEISRLGVLSVVLFDDGEHLACSSMDGNIRIISISKWSVERSIRAGPVDCWTLSLGPTPQTLVSGTYTGAINLWDLSSGSLMDTVDSSGRKTSVGEPSSNGFSLSVAGHKSLVAVGHKDGVVHLFDFNSISKDQESFDVVESKELKGHALPVRSLAFSPDGRIVYAASDDASVGVFSAAGGERIGVLRGHSGWVYAVAASATHIATASADRNVKVWDAETKECVATFDAHPRQAFTVGFSPDGSLLASGGGGGDLQVYQIAKSASR